MGLDMYLKASLYTSKNFSESELNTKLRELIPEVPETDNINSIQLKVEVGYWRKANHIHHWFVENVQNGNDDCGYYYVSREDLQTLKDLCTKTNEYLDTCEKIQDEKYPEYYTYVVNEEDVELQTKSGFFFGSTEYDKWYYKNNLDTITIIDKCLALPKKYEFEYTSSW